jgi:hypothetical protein
VKTHDYTRRGWGHDFVIWKAEEGGQRLITSGWGRGISKGDFLILPNDGGTTRYAVDTIEYKWDPPDMWSATLVFAPRTDEEKQEG